MALSAKLIRVDVPASTGSQAVTGVGFAPVALIAFASGQTGDGVGAGLVGCVGFATGSSARVAYGANGDDAVATANVARVLSTSRFIDAPNSSGTANVIEADLTSLDADGFTLLWSAVTSGVDVFVLCLAGASLTNAKAGNFAKITTTGNQAVTGVGFQPDVVLFLGTKNTASGRSSSAMQTLGAARTTSERWAAAAASQDGAGGTAGRKLFTDKCIETTNSTGTTSSSADLVSLDGDGFTVNWSSSSASAELVGYLALKGGSFKVGTVTVPASTGSQATTGVGFQPAAVLFCGAGLVAANLGAVANADWRFAVGAATAASARGATWSGDKSGANPSITKNASRSDLAYASYSLASTPALENGADLTSLDSDGFTLNWSTVTSQDVVGYVAFGPGGSGATTVSPPVATATGAGLAPTDLVAQDPPVAAATGAGAAPSPLVAQNVPLATATGAALAPAVTYTPYPIAPPVATATGAASAPTVALAQDAPAATATGAGVAPTVALTAAVPSATATGQAIAPALALGPYLIAPPTATAAGDAFAPAATVSQPASVAAATGAGLAPLPLVAVNVPTAGATGAALAPAVTYTPYVVAVPAATATGAAFAPTVQSGEGTIQPPAATATGAAFAPSVVVSPSVPVATAQGAAVAPGVVVTIPAALAAASGLAVAPTTSLVILPPTATAAGASPAPTVLAPYNVLVPVATATARASAPAATVILPIDGTLRGTVAILPVLSAAPRLLPHLTCRVVILPALRASAKVIEMDKGFAGETIRILLQDLAALDATSVYEAVASGATVTVTLVSADGTETSAGTVVNEDGDYYVDLVRPAAGQYTAKIEATAGGKVGRWKTTLTAGRF